MKVRLDSDEWYPVYSIRDDYGYEVDVNLEAVTRWKAATAAFEAAQNEMAEFYNAAQDADRDRKAQAKANQEAADKAERDRAARERQVVAAEQQAKRDAMWAKIKADGGHVYDAEGNLVGTITESANGVRLAP